MKASLVIQSFGRVNEYRRAAFTILSFYAHVPQDRYQVVLYTDNPDWFRPVLEGLPVLYEVLNKDRIRQMRGGIDFLHRMKIAEIDHALQLTGLPILYADSDTFFTGNPAPLLDQLSENVAYMHLHEYRFSEMDKMLEGDYGKTMMAFIKLIREGTFQTAQGKPFPVALSDSSWNAGVILLHPSHSRLLPDVYALTDQFFPATRNHAAEQYAFSLVLQKNLRLRPCDEVIYHYWYRVKKQVTDLFLEEQMQPGWMASSLEAKASSAASWAQRLPAYFEMHPLMIRDAAIQAFLEGRTGTGYWQSIRLLVASPRLFFPFLKDIAYYTKRRLNGAK